MSLAPAATFCSDGISLTALAIQNSLGRVLREKTWTEVRPYLTWWIDLSHGAPLETFPIAI